MRRTLAMLCTLAMLLGLCVPSALAGKTDPLLNDVGSLPLVQEPVTITLGLQQNQNVIDYQDNALTRLIQDKTGVTLNFEIFPEVDADTKLLLMVTAGTKLPDVLTFGPTGNDSLRNQMADAGALLPMDAYYDPDTGIADQFYASAEKHGLDPVKLLNLSRSVDGHIYGLIGMEQLLTNMYDYRAWINQTWLDTLGLAAPTTIDELTQVLIAFRDKDPNGNGKPDEVPMSGSNGNSLTSNSNPMTWLQNLFIFRARTGNLLLPLDQTNGKFDVSYDKEAYREFLKYVNFLVKEGLLDQAAFTQNQTEMRAQLQADTETIGMMFGSANGFGANIKSWQPLEQPTGFYGDRTVTVNNPSTYLRFMITADCKNPEVAFLLGAMSYDDTLGDYFWLYSCRYGEKDVDWRYAVEGEESIFKEIGILPSMKVNTVTWSTPSSKHYQNTFFSYLATGNFAIEVFDGNEAHGERLHGRSVSMNMQYAPALENVVGKILYTEEERDAWSEIRTTLQNYILESSSLFAVGQLDPNSDADWQTYLSELEKLAYKELIAMDEQAYTRTLNIK